MTEEIFVAAIYFAVGLLIYLLGYGPVDWSDAWVYVIAILWPAVLIWWSLPYLLLIGVVIACGYAVFILFGQVRNYIRNRF